MVTNTVIVIESGIGGMALGFQKAGFNVAAAFEKDKNASDVYKENINQKIYRYSLLELQPEDVPDADVIAADLTKLRPLHRGHVLLDMNPQYFEALYNIFTFKHPKAFLIVMKKGMCKDAAFEKAVDGFQRLGYSYKYSVINSREMTGLPVNENRLYLIGYRNDPPYVDINFPNYMEQVHTLPFRELFSSSTDEEEYYRGDYGQIEETTKDDCFLCWRKDRYIERPYASWNVVKMPLVRINGQIRKLTPYDVARLKGFPESFTLSSSTNKARLYRMLLHEPNVQVIQRIAYQLMDSFVQTPLRRMQEHNAEKFERIFAAYMDKKTGGKNENEHDPDRFWDYKYVYYGNSYCFDLKFYNSNSIAGHNIQRVCELLKKQPLKENSRIILAAANVVSDEIKNKCREKYNISVWDVKNLIWLFDEFPVIKNEFIALLNFPTEDISPERPEPYIFDEPEETQGEIDLKEQLRRIRPGREEYHQYENICIDILKYVLGDYLTLWYVQEKTDNGMYRFDLCCKIKSGVDQDFFETIKRYFNTKYIVFEFKNYSERITQQEIYTTEKYLYEKALRRVAIIISRNGADENALAAARGSLRENGKLILCLSDKDLIELIDIKDKNEQPAGLFFEAMLDDLLIHLEK